GGVARMPPPGIEPGPQVPETCVISFSPRGRTHARAQAATTGAYTRQRAPRRPQRLALLAPAKVNAHLRIVGRRSDGYHLLESVMVPISLFDRIVVRLRSDSAVQLV